MKKNHATNRKQASSWLHDRKAAIAVLAALFIVLLLALVAFSIDLGYLLVARTELQRSADSAALAASWELIDEGALRGDTSMGPVLAKARTTAQAYAAQNAVSASAPSIADNAANYSDGDIVIGHVGSLSDPGVAMTFDDPLKFNAVHVRIRRTDDQNGRVPLFFARIFGIDRAASGAEATAAILKSINGFRLENESPEKLPLLPFALDEETWLEWRAGNAIDQWLWDEATQMVASGSDEIGEMNLYPQDTGNPSNRGTVNIGISANSASHVSQQITDGVSSSDLAYHGGELQFDNNGELMLSGDPGISAGFKDELAAIIGQPRMIPVFREINRPGENAEYTIVKFIGIRILEVDLTGNDKRVLIQPANVITKGLIPGQSHGTFIYGPARLIQ